MFAAGRQAFLAALLSASSGQVLSLSSAPHAETALLGRRPYTHDVRHHSTFPSESSLEDAHRPNEASADRGRSVKALEARQELAGGDQAMDPTRPDKYSLSHGELSDIYSVDCLEERQKDPRSPCWRVGTSEYAEEPGPLNIGSFPSWRDRRCRSNGQLFCDPDGLIQNATVARGVTESLGFFRQTVRVQCGQLESNLQASLAPLHTRPFSLGVAVAYDWPDNEIDNDSLQKFGENLFRQWGMLPFYNGVDTMNGLNPAPNTQSQAETNCPNAAMIIILPKHDVVYTATPGCQFFCHDNGGQAVDDAVLATLEERGLAEAIVVGIREVSSVLGVANKVPHDMQTYGPRSYWRRDVSLQDKYQRSETAWIIAMRMLFALVIFLAVAICGQLCWISAGQPLKTKLQRTAAAAAARRAHEEV